MLPFVARSAVAPGCRDALRLKLLRRGASAGERFGRKGSLAAAAQQRPVVVHAAGSGARLASAAGESRITH